jgi:PAS domain S-box-containing protein
MNAPVQEPAGTPDCLHPVALPAAAAAPRTSANPERRKAQAALKALLALTASGSGEEFFRLVVQQLAEFFAVKYVLLGTLEETAPRRVRTLANWAGDGLGENFSYDLAGTPCEQVGGLPIADCQLPSGNRQSEIGNLIYLRAGVRQQFPHDGWLHQMAAEAYVGVPLCSASGQPVGLLVLADPEPLALSEVQRDLLTVLGVRVGNELERLRTEQALRASEDRFHQLAEQTGDIFWIEELQPAPRLVYLSPAFEQIYGCPRTGFLQDATLLDRCIHPADVGPFHATFEQALRGRASRVKAEFRIVRPDGAERWLEDHATIFRQLDGQAIRISGVTRDITARKQAQLALLAERERFRELFEHSPDAIFLESLDGVVLEVNQAAGELHGLPREQLVGRRVTELVPPAHRAAVQRDFGRVAAGRIKVIEGYSLHRSGAAIPVELHVSRLPQAGQPVRRVEDGTAPPSSILRPPSSSPGPARLLVHVRDITARKETELALESERARFRSLFENSPTAMWEADFSSLFHWLAERSAASAGSVAAWPPGDLSAQQHALGLVRLLGMNRAAFALHTATRLAPSAGVLPGALVGEQGAAFAKLCGQLARGATSFELEASSRRENGRPLHLLLDVCVPHNAGRPDFAHTILAGTDITERRLATARLEGQRRILELIARGQPLATVLTELVRQIEAQCDGLAGCLFLLSDDGATLQALTAPSLPPEALAALDGESVATGDTTVALAARTGQPVEVADYQIAPVSERCGALASQFHIRASLAYPVRSRADQIIGVFGCYYATPHPPFAAQHEVLETAGALLSVAVERHAHDRALEAGATALKEANAALLTLARSEVIAGGDLPAALREVAEAGARGVGVGRASIWFFSADGSELVCQDVFDRAAGTHTGGPTFAVADHRPYFAAIQRERLLAIPDVLHDPRLASFVASYLQPLGITAVLDVGIRQGDRLTGIVCLQQVAPARAWTPEQLLFAGSLADIFSLALQTRERQRAEAALRQSEEHYRSVVDALAEGVILADTEGRLTTINRAAEEILGLPHDRLLAQPLSDPAWQTLRPDGQPMLADEYPANVTLRTGQPQSDVIMGVRRSDDDLVWISVNTRPLGVGADGQAARAVVSFTDITERRAAQQALEERNVILRAISDAQARFIGEAEPAAGFAGMVENLLQLTGSEFGLVGEVEVPPGGSPTLAVHAFSERTPGAAAQRFFADHPRSGRHITELDNLFGEVIRSGQPLITSDFAHVPRRDLTVPESPRTERYLALPLKHAGQVVGLVGLGNRPGGYSLDQVTVLEPFLATCAGMIEAMRNQRRREAAEAHIRQLNAGLEQRVLERTAELAAINNELGEFAYVVTHDLKAPLRGISQLCEWIVRDHAAQLDPEGVRYFEMLRQRVLHLHQLVDGLLACARVGRAPEPELAVDTHQLVQQVLGHLSPSGHIAVEVAANLPVVQANPQRLHQVFQNLLDNAFKYLDKPQGRIRVCAARREGEWEFSVADNGPGIPARFHEKVFQIFQRLTVDADLPGTGLGLTLVKRIIENRGGRIWIESTVGGGTTMFFTWPDLPRRQSDRATRQSSDALLHGEMPDRH